MCVSMCMPKIVRIMCVEVSGEARAGVGSSFGTITLGSCVPQCGMTVLRYGARSVSHIFRVEYMFH